MLKDWHREDITDALSNRGWAGPMSEEPEDKAYFAGERLVFTRGGAKLLVSFVADLGAGYTGPKSLEEAVAKRPRGTEARLWLRRRRDSKWRSELVSWANSLSRAESCRLTRRCS